MPRNLYNRRSAQRTVSPSTELWTTAQVESYLRLDAPDTNESALIDSYVKAAREKFERVTGRAFVTQTWQLTMDSFYSHGDAENHLDGFHELPVSYYNDYNDELDLPVLPVQSVTSIVTYDDSNAASTFSSDNYQLDTSSGRIYLDAGQTWPTDIRDRSGIVITFVAGYGDQAADVPEALRQAVLIYAGALYDSRGTCDVPAKAKELVESYIIRDDLWLA